MPEQSTVPLKVSVLQFMAKLLHVHGAKAVPIIFGISMTTDQETPNDDYSNSCNNSRQQGNHDNSSHSDILESSDLPVKTGASDGGSIETFDLAPYAADFDSMVGSSPA